MVGFRPYNRWAVELPTRALVGREVPAVKGLLLGARALVGLEDTLVVEALVGRLLVVAASRADATLLPEFGLRTEYILTEILPAGKGRRFMTSGSPDLMLRRRTGSHASRSCEVIRGMVVL